MVEVESELWDRDKEHLAHTLQGLPIKFRTRPQILTLAWDNGPDLASNYLMDFISNCAAPATLAYLLLLKHPQQAPSGLCIFCSLGLESSSPTSHILHSLTFQVFA